VLSTSQAMREDKERVFAASFGSKEGSVGDDVWEGGRRAPSVEDGSCKKQRK
jgi:hypothetical protein